MGRSRSLLLCTCSCKTRAYSRSSSACARRLAAYPYALHVKSHSVCGYAFVVYGLEEVVWVVLVHESAPEGLDVRLELVGQEEFVGEGGERQVEIVRQLPILQLGGL